MQAGVAVGDFRASPEEPSSPLLPYPPQKEEIRSSDGKNWDGELRPSLQCMFAVSARILRVMAQSAPAIANDAGAYVFAGRLPFSGRRARRPPIAMRAISGAHNGAAVVAVWPMPSNHRAARPDATGVIATGGAGGRIGLRDLDGEQAEGQQAGNNRLSSRSSPASEFARVA